MDKEEQIEVVVTKSSEDKRSKSKTNRIICPLCMNNESHQNFKGLLKHLTDHHEINIVQSSQKFSNFNDFLEWRSLENRDVDYCTHRTTTYRGKKYISYRCNRSDSEGFVPTCKVRNLKTGGSIKINGMCPSKIDLTLLENGNVTMNFIETHVGHENELRSKKLTVKQEKYIVDQMLAGVTSKRILNNARKIENDKLSRMSILNAKDLANIKRKYNIDNRRHTNDVITVSDESSDEDNNLQIDEPSTSRMNCNDFIDETVSSSQNLTSSCNDTENFQDYEAKMWDKLKTLNPEGKKKLFAFALSMGNEMYQTQSQCQGPISKKRKIEKQTYSPRKK